VAHNQSAGAAAQSLTSEVFVHERHPLVLSGNSRTLPLRVEQIKGFWLGAELHTGPLNAFKLPVHVCSADIGSSKPVASGVTEGVPCLLLLITACVPTSKRCDNLIL